MGGNAVPGVGTIHKTEIAPTLRVIEQILGLPGNELDNRLLGSVGKKDYSGDIDIVMDPVPHEKVMDFFNKLKKAYGHHSVRKTGAMLNISAPIENYDESLQGRLPRTGTVQVDFIFGKVAFTKLFHHSPGNESIYKGVHRNIAISAIAGFTERTESVEVDDQGRPVDKLRWKWGPQGFCKVRRFSRKNENGDWLKSQKDEVLSESLTTGKEVAEKLFGQDSTEADLNSFETVLAAVKKYFDIEKQNKVFKQIAKNIEEFNARSKKTDLTAYGLPSEISQFIAKDDK